jgi:hypothetical protein
MLKQQPEATAKPLTYNDIANVIAQAVQPSAIRVHQIIIEPAPHAVSMMPLIVGSARRDHRTIGGLQFMRGGAA